MKPRERLLKSGPDALSVEELIAILLRTGGDGKNVMDLARMITNVYPRLSELSAATVQELMRIKGVGLAKATSLKAALELGKRLHLEMVMSPKKLYKPDAVAEMCQDLLFSPTEVLRVIGVDNDLRYIAHRDFQNSLKSIVEVGMKDLMSFLLRIGADAFFLVHNHRSVPNPSRADVIFTKRVSKASDILGIRLVDHVIVHPKGFTSFRNEGLI